MKGYDTFNFANVLEVDNYILVGLAMWKMFTYFWPLILIAGFLLWLEKRNEVFHENKN